MNAQSEQNNEEIPSELPELLRHVFHQHHLGGHQETDADGGEVDDPRGHLHHHDARALEEVEQRLTVLSAGGDGDPRHDAEHDQSQQVGVVVPLSLEVPGALVIWIIDSLIRLRICYLQ